MKRYKFIGTLFLLVLVMNSAISSELPDLFGEHELGMRTRYQSVNDNWLGDANAFTTRLTLTSKFILDQNEQWQLTLQPNYVYAFNEDHYNSVTVTRHTSPIPDPDGFNLTQGLIQYDSNNFWQASIGRQMVSFDNERFIGSVEFWQTPQNFDAVTLQYNNQENLDIQYVYSNKVHRIFGQDSTLNLPADDVRFGLIEQRPVNELGQHRLDSHFLNIAFNTENNLSIVGYHYYIYNHDQAWFSTKTTGLRVSDEFKPGKIKYRYTAEFALQNEIKNNPANYQTWYSLFEVGIQYKSHRLDISQETLSQDDFNGFKTPLATNHKFQGWADAFAGYGVQAGIRDQYLTYRGRKSKLNWRIVYHNFDNYNNSENIGTELDIELGYRFTRQWQLKLIYADYRSKKGLQYFPKANHDLSTWFASIAYNI